MSSQGTWVRGEIYAAGEHIATYENDLTTPTTFFTHSDHLGTERVQTAVNGSSCETITNTAFGDGMNETGSCDPTALRFTDKLRDYETNLDDFGARFYSSQLGRFMSADWSAVPEAVPYANLNNPQTLNLYAIVADNPETFADLDGHCEKGETAASACPDPPDTGSSLGEPSSEKVIEHPTGTVPSTSVAQEAQAKQQENQTQQQKDDQAYHQALQQREQQFRDQQAGPAPGSEAYVQATLGKAGQEADQQMKVLGTAMAGVEAVGVAPIVATSETAETVVAGARAGANTVATALDNSVESATRPASSAADRFIPGGSAAIKDFAEAFAEPTKAATTPAGIAGAIVRTVFDRIF